LHFTATKNYFNTYLELFILNKSGVVFMQQKG